MRRAAGCGRQHDLLLPRCCYPAGLQPAAACSLCPWALHVLMLWVASKDSLVTLCRCRQPAQLQALYTQSGFVLYSYGIHVCRRAVGGRRWFSCSRVWFVFPRCWRRRGERALLAGVCVVHATRTAEFRKRQVIKPPRTAKAPNFPLVSPFPVWNQPIRSSTQTQIALHDKAGMRHLQSKSSRAALLLCNTWAGWLNHA